MGFFEAIANFFRALFGGKKTTSATTDVTVKEVEQEEVEEQTSYELKTDKDMFYQYIVIGETVETQNELWNEVVANETAGVYDYKLTGQIAWYHIQNGQLVGNGTVAKPVITNSNNVEGTNMRQSVFNVMVAGEKIPAQVEYVKKQMQEKDAIGEYPYTISSDAWMYTITKPAEPYFSMYGTQYSATQKHK